MRNAYEPHTLTNPCPHIHPHWPCGVRGCRLCLQGNICVQCELKLPAPGPAKAFLEVKVTIKACLPKVRRRAAEFQAANDMVRPTMGCTSCLLLLLQRP
jgi:hypothetical protein